MRNRGRAPARAQQEDLPSSRSGLTRHIAQKGETPVAAAYQGPSVDVPTDSSRAANVHLGPRAVTLIRSCTSTSAYRSRIATCCVTAAGSESRRAPRPDPASRARCRPGLRDCVPRSAGSTSISPDETGWRSRRRVALGGRSRPETAAIRPGRGFDKRLGADFAGPSVTGGSPSPIHRPRHQSCLAHLLRRCRRSAPTIRGAPGRAACRSSSPTPWRSAIGVMRTRSPIMASPWLMGACSPTWAGSSTRHRRCRRPSASRPSRPRVPGRARLLVGLRCGRDRTGAQNTPSSPAVVNRKICGGNRRPEFAADPRNPRECDPHRASTPCRSRTSSPRSCGRHVRLSPRLSTSRRSRITR